MPGQAGGSDQLEVYRSSASVASVFKVNNEEENRTLPTVT